MYIFSFVAPGHSIFIDKYKSKIENIEEVLKYREAVKNIREHRQNKSRQRYKWVQLKGITARIRLHNEEIPVWISDFVCKVIMGREQSCAARTTKGILKW